MQGSTARFVGVASFLAAAVTLLASNAHAQIVELAPTEEAGAEQPLHISVAYEHRFDADIDGNNGEFSVDGVRVGLNYALSFSDDVKWDNYLSYRHTHYDFSASSPWESINGATWASRLSWSLSDSWSLYGGPLVMFEGESGSDFSDGVVGGALLGFTWISSPDLSLGLAFGAVSQIEDDARFLLIPTVNWKFADAWRLRTGILGYGAGVGIGAEVDWQLTDSVEWAVGAQLQRKRMQLDGDGTNPNGVGQERSLPIYAKLSWQVAEPLALELFGGVRVAGELRLENRSGSKLSDQDYDPQGTLGLQAKLRF
jgi:hypothetical protein